jgi:branched-chain amino acid transport system permease protein
LFGLDLSGDRSYFWFELVVLLIAMFFTRNLRAGRLGRILAAMRDSETGATSVGISLRKYKLFIFAAGAFVAAIGGSMLMLADLAFTERSYSPLYSLFWFTAVVVAGLSYLAGAPLAAFLFIFFDVLAKRDGASLFVIGLLAVFIAFLPGGLVGTVTRLTRGAAVPASLRAKYTAVQDLPRKPTVEPGPAPAPSTFAQKLLEQGR